MRVSTQLKHVLVLLEEKGKLDAVRLSNLMGYTPVRAEIASPETKALLDLFLKLRFIKKVGRYYTSNFTIKNREMGELSAKEIDGIKKTILNNKRVIREIASSSYNNGEFNYESENLLHRLLSEIGIILSSDKGHFLSEGLFRHAKSEIPQKYVNETENEEIGKFAERVIFKIEYNKLSKKSDYLKYLEHTSLKNDRAGYDIKTFDPTDKKEFYLEVKGTTAPSTEFFITSNELNMAQKLGRQYKIIVVRGINLENNSYDDIIEIPNPATTLHKQYSMSAEVYRVTGKHKT